MPKSMIRMFGIVTKFRGRLVLSQVLLFLTAMATVGFATLTQGLVNQGMEAGDPEALLNIGAGYFNRLTGCRKYNRRHVDIQHQHIPAPGSDIA